MNEVKWISVEWMIDWMIECGAIYPLGVKVYFFNAPWECTHNKCTIGYTSCGAINEGLLSNKSFTRN